MKKIFLIFSLSILIIFGGVGEAIGASCLCHFLNGKSITDSPKCFGPNNLDPSQIAAESCSAIIIDQGGVFGLIAPNINNTLLYTECTFYLNDECNKEKLTSELIEDLNIRTPEISIGIPGLDFTDVPNTIYTDEEGKNYMLLPWLPEYISALYKFSLGTISIVAVIMIMIQGIKILLSGTTIAGEGFDTKTGAKNSGIMRYKNIGRIIMGLLIAWGSYLILYTINPNLVNFKALKINYVKGLSIQETVEHEEDVTDGSNIITGDMAIIAGDNIINYKSKKIAKELLPDIQKAALELKNKNIQMVITSGYRPLEQQKALIYANCQNPPGSKRCNPKPGKPTTCILRDNDPKNCPHTTGHAVDMWGFQNGQQCIKQKECSRKSDNDPCRKNECQAAVIEAMRNAGFCNLASEAWHFEKPKMSSSCK